MKISSPSFKHKERIPSKYTCDGQDINPPLSIEEIPDGTRELALIVDDPDAPAKTWVHWVVYQIPVTDKISENSVPGTEGRNDFDNIGYGGPCPPSGQHRYYFKIYALDTKLELEEGIDKRKLEESMEGHILEEAELIGLYKKSEV
ncbi:YbhB/YbcL family Raf kinase inhibitor-like protein [candidate division KSB1 bacterium]|nr:YbhB/YbcL family Raf kinase inhibitor-like protein [candidate division KSB1 bacterium]